MVAPRRHRLAHPGACPLRHVQTGLRPGSRPARPPHPGLTAPRAPASPTLARSRIEQSIPMGTGPSPGYPGRGRRAASRAAPWPWRSSGTAGPGPTLLPGREGGLSVCKLARVGNTQAPPRRREERPKPTHFTDVVPLPGIRVGPSRNLYQLGNDYVLLYIPWTSLQDCICDPIGAGGYA